MYTYGIRRVHRIVDGDTYDLELDLGFYQYGVYRVRLLDVDTPEIYGRNASEEGHLAIEFVRSWLDERMARETLVATTFKADSFGRWLAMIQAIESSDDLATDLLEAGLAQPYEK